MSSELTRGQINSLNRCRVYLHALFFSDLVTADGRNFESHVFDPGGPNAVNSIYLFPREEPTKSDWELWSTYWRGKADEGGRLRTPLGKWVHATHRQWKWYKDTQTEQAYRHEQGNYTFYLPCSDTRVTRRANQYRIAWSEMSDLPHNGRPISVEEYDEEIRPLQDGPYLAQKCPSKPDDFWEYLNSLGGSWMWQHVGTGEEWNKNDLTWLIDGIKMVH